MMDSSTTRDHQGICPPVSISPGRTYTTRPGFFFAPLRLRTGSRRPRLTGATGQLDRVSASAHRLDRGGLDPTGKTMQPWSGGTRPSISCSRKKP
jgi:hypothetical protein